MPTLSRYRTPALLSDINVLDMLELAGTTTVASSFLHISQPTVSRRYQALARDFGLAPKRRRREPVHYGTSPAITHLRLSARSHRLEEGFARIGTDLFHQFLLADLPQVLPVPQHLRPAEHWADLVRLAVIDGAVVSSLEVDQVKEPNTWRELSLHPLGSIQLELVAAGQTDDAAQLLAPHRVLAPGLWQALKCQGLELHPVHSQHSSAKRWLELLSHPLTALALPSPLLETAPWRDQGLRQHPLARPMSEELILILPKAAECSNTLPLVKSGMQHGAALQKQVSHWPNQLVSIRPMHRAGTEA
jgi:hypothetical protein